MNSKSSERLPGFRYLSVTKDMLPCIFEISASRLYDTTKGSVQDFYFTHASNNAFMECLHVKVVSEWAGHANPCFISRSRKCCCQFRMARSTRPQCHSGDPAGTSAGARCNLKPGTGGAARRTPRPLA